MERLNSKTKFSDSIRRHQINLHVRRVFHFISFYLFFFIIKRARFSFYWILSRCKMISRVHFINVFFMFSWPATRQMLLCIKDVDVWLHPKVSIERKFASVTARISPGNYRLYSNDASCTCVRVCVCRTRERFLALRESNPPTYTLLNTSQNAYLSAFDTPSSLIGQTETFSCSLSLAFARKASRFAVNSLVSPFKFSHSIRIFVPRCRSF